jgi:hypothetical protein
MTADQAAAIVQLLTSTIEGEGSATRKLLAAVPNARTYLINGPVLSRERASASEPRDRSEPAKRRARERVGESEGRSPSDKTSRTAGSKVPAIYGVSADENAFG